MPLIRSYKQKRQTLEEFYSEWAAESNLISSNIGKSMLKVIDLINKTFVETKLYGLTSHAHLLLQSEDKPMSDWHVTLIAHSDEFHIEYKMPEESQPWKHATVKGETKSIEEFKRLIIIAIQESRGWDKNKELNKLFNQIKT